MKRRNVDPSKTRRPVRKIPKIYDGFYTGVVVYVKLALLWVAVMGGDFVLDFRLEYLYPIYLLVHSAYEAYKFQGVAFALLLVCIVLSVDMICLGAMPLGWLYLLGSIAVWGQMGYSLTPWGTVCLLPVLVCLDGKSWRPAPSQPFSPLAAHCVGFPLVSIGFAVKSFVGTKMKQKTRGDVGRQNDALFSILWDALPSPAVLPAAPVSSPPLESPNNNDVAMNSNGSAVLVTTNNNSSKKQQSPGVARRKSVEANGDIFSESSTTSIPNGRHHHHQVNGDISHHHKGGGKVDNSNHNHHNHQVNSSTPSPVSSSLPNNNATNNSSQQYETLCPTCAAAMLAPKKKKEECCIKLESEVRRLRSDLHSLRSIESDLRGQISSLQMSERNLRGDVALLQGEHEALQLKYSALLAKSQEERQSYEKKLTEKLRQKDNALKKQTKVSQECCGDCKRKLRDAEREKEILRRDMKLADDKTARLERELQNVKSTLMHEQKHKESSAETVKLMSLLTALQDQVTHLESSLSAETRLKLDLFSALGEARRQLSIRDAMLKAKEDDLEELRSKYVELLAVSDFTHHHHHHTQQQQQPHHSHSQQHQQIHLGQSHPQHSPPPATSQSQPMIQAGGPQRLKNLMGVVDGSQQSPTGRENLTFSPLIES